LAGRADIGAALRHVAPGDGHPLRTVVVDLDDYVAEQQTARGRDGQRSEALEALVRLAREYSAMEPEATVGDLRGWLMTAMGLDGPRGVDAVHLVTFHAAKGLEWPVVHIAGLEEGFVPVSYAKTPEAEAEERRLLHVAITRAEQTLRISWASTRTMRDAPVARRASRYVDSLAVAKADLDVLMTTDPGEGLARSRDALRTAGAADLDRALLDDLRAWRARVARRAGIAPAVVASDRVLSDVARHRPTDRAALGAILGVGPMVVDAHGDDLLEIVSAHAATAGTP
jgi:DNA helicase-2/ATP-dependent DNA helicase PcrA